MHIAHVESENEPSDLVSSAPHDSETLASNGCCCTVVPLAFGAKSTRKGGSGSDMKNCDVLLGVSAPSLELSSCGNESPATAKTFTLSIPGELVSGTGLRASLLAPKFC